MARGCAWPRGRKSCWHQLSLRDHHYDGCSCNRIAYLGPHRHFPSCRKPAIKWIAMSQFDLRPPDEEQRALITAGLDPDERRVLLEHGTEAAFCGVFLDNHKEGIYACRFCGLPLFRSSAKFDSGTGWPSFFQPYDESHIRRVR